MNTTTKGLWWAVLTGICWGVLAVALRVTLNYATSGSIAWVRMLTAWLILVLYWWIKDRKKISSHWRFSPTLWLAGGFLALNYLAYMKGLELTSASNAQVMIQLGPLMLMLVGILKFKERPSFTQTLGLIVSTLGLLIFSWDQLNLAWQNAGRYLWGNLWITIAALSWAAFAVMQKMAQNRWHSQEFNLTVYLVCTLALAPFCHWSEIPNWSGVAWLLILGCGLNTVVAYGAFAESLRLAPANQVSVILSANPLLTIALVSGLSALQVDWIHSEPMAWRSYLGALMVVLGVIMTVWRRRSERSRFPVLETKAIPVK